MKSFNITLLILDKTVTRFGFPVILWLITVVGGHAQHNDSLHVKLNLFTKFNASPWKQVVSTPAMLITAGLLSMTDNEVFDKFEIHEERQELIPRFRTHIDDYAQYAPIAAVYALNMAGMKGKNNFANRTALLLKSELLMLAITYPLKKIVGEPRPDTGARNSFPSGHTAQAFAAATFLAKEYGDEHPFIAISAYALASGIGVLRVMNNRHWSSDVLAGAGIGILSTNIAYFTHQYKWGKQKVGKTVMMPSYNSGAMGFYVGYKFN
jgi:membrane-associated phospholipid phosphatase